MKKRALDLTNHDVSKINKDIERKSKIDKTAWKNNKLLDCRSIKNMNKADTWEFLRKQGFIDSNKLYLNQNLKVVDIWKDEPCYIIGSGGSLKPFIDKFGWKFFDYKHTIGLNHIIEDYDKTECVLFLDRRFLTQTKYNIKNYSGKIFAQANTGLKPFDNITTFTTQNKRPTLKFENGLFSGNFSGLAALNLVLIMGANPIYLIGFGMGKDSTPLDGYHYKKDYIGESKNQKRYNKYITVMRYFNRFSPYASRIINVMDGKNSTAALRHMTIKQFDDNIKKNKNLEITQIPKIVHYSFSNDINVHADITRNIIKECYGNHILLDKKQAIPKADLYILEHFQSINHFVANFPHKNKAIDIVHTVNCIPTNDFRKIIALTNAWKRYLKQHLVKDCEMIHVGIDLDEYKDTWPDYDKKVFGRITRWSPGKIHPKWNGMVNHILDTNPDSKCLFYTELKSVKQRIPLTHHRMIYDKTCKIHMFKGDFLKNMSIYVHANGSFVDTFSHGTLEAMATGLPVIILNSKVGAVKEVAGDAGIICDNLEQLKTTIINLLHDKDLRIEYGKKSKERAAFFTKEKMINKFNKVILECLRK